MKTVKINACIRPAEKKDIFGVGQEIIPNNTVFVKHPDNFQYCGVDRIHGHEDMSEIVTRYFENNWFVISKDDDDRVSFRFKLTLREANEFDLFDKFHTAAKTNLLYYVRTDDVVEGPYRIPQYPNTAKLLLAVQKNKIYIVHNIQQFEAAFYKKAS